LLAERRTAKTRAGEIFPDLALLFFISGEYSDQTEGEVKK